LKFNFISCVLTQTVAYTKKVAVITSLPLASIFDILLS